MFAVQFQPRFSDRPAGLAGDDGHPCDRGQEPVVCASRSLAEALAGLCAAKGYVDPHVIDVGDASPESLIRWE